MNFFFYIFFVVINIHMVNMISAWLSASLPTHKCYYIIPAKHSLALLANSTGSIFLDGESHPSLLCQMIGVSWPSVKCVAAGALTCCHSNAAGIRDQENPSSHLSPPPIHSCCSPSSLSHTHSLFFTSSSFSPPAVINLLPQTPFNPTSTCYKTE